MPNEEAREAIVKARVHLLLHRPFFGSLAMPLEPVEAAKGELVADTMATDGVHLFYYPKYVLGLKDAEQISAVVHEVGHVAFGHFARQAGRESRKWNRACDYALNAVLKEDGFEIPQSWLYNARYEGLSAEKIYDILPKGNEALACCHFVENANGKANGKKVGGVKVVPWTKELAREWRDRTAVAACRAKLAGKMPAGMEEMVSAVLEPKVSWRATLRQFVAAEYKSDYSFFPPSRRFSHVYMPSLRSYGLGTVFVGIDSSGSIDSETLLQFVSELQGILDSYECEVRFLEFDTVVQNSRVFRSGERIGDVKVKGRGGTMFGPVFAKFAEMVQEGTRPACAVILTDGYQSDAWPQEPGYPVLWVMSSEVKAKWGITIPL